MTHTSWGEICTLEYGKALRDYVPEQTETSCFRVFGTNGPIGWTAQKLSDEAGIIVGRKGAYRGIHFSPDPFFVIDTAYYLRPKNTKLDLGWAYYKLLTVDLDQVDVGAAIPTTNREAFYALPVSIPESQVQRDVAAVLSTYDELIEINRRRMGLLEKAARLLYEEWFVRLRFPGHELTKITNRLPLGWARKPLEEVAEFRLGKMLDQAKNKGDLLPYLANVNVRWGSFEFDNLRTMRFEDDELETYGLKFGDIVMCEGGEPGRCAIWKEQLPGMMIQKAIHRIRSKAGMNHEYLYQSLRNQGQSGHLATLFTGATIKHFPREKLAKVTVFVPPAQLLDLFTSHVRPIENQIGILENQNQKLRTARDLLLPRLMSGEIEV